MTNWGISFIEEIGNRLSEAVRLNLWIPVSARLLQERPILHRGNEVEESTTFHIDMGRNYSREDYLMQLPPAEFDFPYRAENIHESYVTVTSAILDQYGRINDLEAAVAAAREQTRRALEQRYESLEESHLRFLTWDNHYEGYFHPEPKESRTIPPEAVELMRLQLDSIPAVASKPDGEL